MIVGLQRNSNAGADSPDCLNWQHIPCLDLSTNDIESEYYFCHLCLPDRHKNRLNEGANTLPPSQRGRPRKQTKKMIDQQRQVSPVSTNFGRYPKKIRGSRWESASTAPSIDDSELDSDLKLMRGLLSPDVDNQTSDDCRKSKPRTRKARKNELDSPNRLQTSLVKEKAVGHCDHDRGTKDHVKVLEYLDLAPEEFRKSMSLEVSTFARLLQKAHLVLTELQFRIYDDHGMLIEWEKIDYKKRSHAVADLERRECRLFKHENSALWLLRHAYNQVVEGQERIKTQGHDTPSSIAAQLRSRPKQDTRLPFKSIKPGSVMTTKIAKERSTGSQ